MYRDPDDPNYGKKNVSQKIFAPYNIPASKMHKIDL